VRAAGGSAAKDESGIHSTLSTYIWLADQGRMDDLSSLFTPGASYVNRGGAYDGEVQEGREQIRRFLGSIVADFAAAAVTDRNRHHESSIRLRKVGPGRYRSDSYFVAIGEGGPDHWGTYKDVLVKVSGSWYFEQRICTVEGMAASSWQRRVRSST